MYSNLLVVTGVLIGFVASEDCQSPPTNNCTLFSSKSDRLSVQDMKRMSHNFFCHFFSMHYNRNEQKVTSGKWFMLFGSDFSEDQTHGKCIYEWHTQDNSDVIRSKVMCYNFELGECDDFSGDVRWQDNDCGEIVESGVNYTLYARFYSQDPDQYLWYYTCYSPNRSVDCEVEYLDLILRDQRLRGSMGEEVNLQHLPWHLIAIDLKNNFGFEFTSSRVFYYWKGPECDFNGDIVTDSAYRNEFNVLVLILASLLPLFNYN